MDVLKALSSRLSWRFVLYWGALALVLWGFVELVGEVYEQEGFFFDEPVLTWLYGHISPGWTAVMRALSIFGNVPVMGALSLATAIGLWFASRREGRFFAVSVGGAALFMVLAKVLVARPRPELFPDVKLWQEASASFPSGHATGSMAYFLALYLVVARLAPRWRWLAGLLGAVMVALVGLSRLYLQVHYPSDILAGFALSALWVSGVNAIYRYRGRDRSRRTVLLTLPSAVVARYRQEAERQGKREDEVVAAALEEHYGLASSRAPAGKGD